MLSIAASATYQSTFKFVPAAKNGAAKTPDKAAVSTETDADNARAAELTQATATLSQAKSEMASSRKAAVRQTIDRLKAMIDTLSKVAGTSGAVAKQVALLAKELAAAVREYRAAGGSAADVPMTATAQSSAPSEAGSDKETAEQEADGEATSADAVPNPQTKATETAAPAIQQTNEASAKEPGKEETKEGKIDDPDQQAANQAKREDEDFARKVRMLKNRLKGILSAARASKTDHPKDMEEIEKSVNSSFKKIDDDLQRIVGPNLDMTSMGTAHAGTSVLDITA